MSSRDRKIEKTAKAYTGYENFPGSNDSSAWELIAKRNHFTGRFQEKGKKCLSEQI